MASAGWIRLHRQILDSAVFQDEHLFRLFAWLLLRAASKRQNVAMDTGRGKTIVELKRGQIIIGRNKGSEQLGWKPSTFRDRLSRLQSLGMVSVLPDTHWSVVSITNWLIYQRDDRESPTGNQQASPTGNQQASGQAIRGRFERIESGDSDEPDTQPTGNQQATNTYKTSKKSKKSKNLNSEPSDSRSVPLASEFAFRVKSANGQTWSLSQAKLQEYRSTFSDAAWVAQELRKARQWCSDNSAKRKTPAGMERFLTSWLSRANDRGAQQRDRPSATTFDPKDAL